MRHPAARAAFPSVFIFVIEVGQPRFIDSMGAEPGLRFFDRPEFMHYLRYAGEREHAMHLRAGSSHGHASSAMFKPCRGVENDGQYCGACKAGQAEVQNHGSGAIIDSEGQPLLNFLCDEIIDGAMGTQENDAVECVGIYRHRNG